MTANLLSYHGTNIPCQFQWREDTDLKELKKNIFQSKSHVLIDVSQITNPHFFISALVVNFFEELEMQSHFVFLDNVQWDCLMVITACHYWNNPNLHVKNFYFPFQSLKDGRLIQKNINEIKYFSNSNYLFEIEPFQIEDELFRPLLAPTQYLHLTNEYSYYYWNHHYKRINYPIFAIDVHSNMLYLNDCAKEYFQLNQLEVGSLNFGPVSDLLQFQTPQLLFDYIRNPNTPITFPLKYKLTFGHQNQQIQNVFIEEYIAPNKNSYYIFHFNQVYSPTNAERRKLELEEMDTDFFKMPKFKEFWRRLDSEFSRAKRLKNKTGIAMVEMINWDELKNKIPGFKLKSLIVDLGEELNNTIRLSDFVAENTESSLVFIFPHLKDESGLLISLEKCHFALEKFFSKHTAIIENHLKIQFSFGGTLINYTDLPVGSLGEQFKDVLMKELSHSIQMAKEKQFPEKSIHAQNLTPELED